MSAEGPGAAPAEAADPFEQFEQFRNSFFLDLEKRKQQNRDLLAQLETYKHENEVLQAELDAVRAAHDAIVSKPYECLPHSEDRNATVPYTTYAKLREQQEITWKSLKVSHQALERYKAKYQRAKDSIRPWQEYASRCEERLIQKAGIPAHEQGTTLSPLHRPSDGVSDLGSSRSPSAGLDIRTNPIKSTQPRSSSTSSPGQRKEGTPVVKSPSKLRVTTLARSSSSTGTVIERSTENTKDGIHSSLQQPDEAMSASAVATDEISAPDSALRSDDTVDSEYHLQPSFNRIHPESTVSYKRGSLPEPAEPKHAGNRQKETADGSPLAPIHIKSEPDSSPVMSVIASELLRTDTLDLDEIGTHIATPRKLQRNRHLFPENSSLSFPPPGATSLQLSSKEDMDKSDLRDARHQEAVPALKFEQCGELGISEAPFLAGYRPRGFKTHEILANWNDRPQGVTRKRKQSPEDIGSITEDGDTGRRSFRPISPSKKLKANRAIQDLLEDSTPAKRMLISPSGIGTTRLQRQPLADIATPTAQSNKRAKVKPISNQVPTPQTGLAKRRSPGKHHSKFKKPPLPPHTPGTNRSPHGSVTPLRQCPLSDLKPEDFRLNPYTHGNLDLTTTEPVRNHEDRRHLHGCTDPNCAQCGQAMRVLAAELPITVGSSLFANTQEEQLTDEERLLKHHLGASFDQARIARMDPADKAELIMQAKVQIVAERSGRHRLRPNARAQTPPGFWDVEMPTTQDMEERAREVEGRAEDLVKERYREAMRPGGRWMFKDE